MKTNYQKELDGLLERIKNQEGLPRLLLHSCCAPCSSYVLEYLSEYFSITVFYYNPNITEPEEYRRRVEEQKRLIAELPVRYPVAFLEGAYEPDRFFQMAEGLERIPEGGERCLRCFALRLSETARTADAGRFDYFTTTLTISPLKNAEALNEIGEQAAKSCRHAAFLPSDFKKKNGYKRSVELSRIYGLYRQDYCGCIYSKAEREAARRCMEEKIETG
ncbi:MAG: epoxyqueuosine reductase QueH [Clostridiales bacterium]|nr:epoxyqueuosine reductase QueH [Clostridiales bacterium]